MKQITRSLLVAALGLASGLTYASEGYVGNSGTTMTRTGYGECLHTGRWSEATAIAECDPEIVAARDGASVAAMEVVVVKEMKAVRLQADALFAFDSADLTDDGKARLNDMLSGLSAADLKDHKDQQVLKDHKDQQVPMVLKDPQDHKEQKGR